MRSEVLDQAAFAALVHGGEPIKRMRQGVKVWRLPDDRIVKLFRPRGRFSRSRLRPANERFAQNARALTRLGFKTVAVERLFNQPEMGCSGVVYEELPGQTLESALNEAESSRLIAALAGLMVDLHGAGVLFRALHLGNLLTQANGDLALIDVEELTVSRGPLRAGARVRNFRHLLRRDLDRQVLQREGFLQLVDVYLSRADLQDRVTRRLRRRLLALADASDWPQHLERS